MQITTQQDDKVVREVRISPIVPNESVTVPTPRGMRPKQAEEPVPRDTRVHVATCPFCRGNEHMIPPEIVTYPQGQTDWAIRIVDNLYPALGNDRPSHGLGGVQYSYLLHSLPLGPEDDDCVNRDHL